MVLLVGHAQNLMEENLIVATFRELKREAGWFASNLTIATYTNTSGKSFFCHAPSYPERYEKHWRTLTMFPDEMGETCMTRAERITTIPL